MNNVLILGSAPNAISARKWPTELFRSLVVINNAWKIRSDWTHNIFPTDFPQEKRATATQTQRLISAEDYVPVQNSYGGFVYAGGTMAITSAYWALGALKPKNLYFFGCDMVYNGSKTHFYGQGTPDPLREDISLRSLEAKTARFECFASLVDCNVFNLSEEKESRLVYRRKRLSNINSSYNDLPRAINKKSFDNAIRIESELNYFISDGKYWKHNNKFDVQQVDRLDKIWLKCLIV